MKRRTFLYIYATCLLCAALTACSSDGAEEAGIPDNNGGGTPSPAVCLQTRADDDAVIDAQAGLYMVSHEKGNDTELVAAGNYVNNMSLIRSGGAWSTAQTIYWADMDTPADFYVYVPYSADVQDARNHVFSVGTDQSGDDAFTRSDFLWGRLADQQPTSETLSMSLTHILSRITVVVTPGNGFADGELKAGDVSVTIGGSTPTAGIDLADGTVSPSGTAQDITCHNNGDLSYTAVAIPQKIPFTNLIRIDYNGSLYSVQNSFNAESGRQYTITLKLNKQSSGLNVGISGWDIVEEDFGGTAE